MAEISVTEVLDVGNDVLFVMGEIDGNAASASGWVSALENHYAADAYDEEGNLKLDDDGEPISEPRPMDEDEKLVYCKRILEEQNPPQPKPVSLSIQG